MSPFCPTRWHATCFNWNCFIGVGINNANSLIDADLLSITISFVFTDGLWTRSQQCDNHTECWEINSSKFHNREFRNGLQVCKKQHSLHVYSFFFLPSVHHKRQRLLKTFFFTRGANRNLLICWADHVSCTPVNLFQSSGISVEATLHQPQTLWVYRSLSVNCTRYKYRNIFRRSTTDFTCCRSTTCIVPKPLRSSSCISINNADSARSLHACLFVWPHVHVIDVHVKFSSRLFLSDSFVSIYYFISITGSKLLCQMKIWNIAQQWTADFCFSLSSKSAHNICIYVQSMKSEVYRNVWYIFKNAALEESK